MATTGPKLITSLTISSLSGGAVVSQSWNFEYNNQGQLVRKTDKAHPSNYTVYEYVGAIPIRIAVYEAGVLKYEYQSPVTLTGYEIEIAYVSRSPSGNLVDSLVEDYIYQDSLFLQADYAYKSAQGIREYRNRFYYDIGKLVQFSTTGYLDMAIVEPLTNYQVQEWTAIPNKLQKQSAFNLIFTFPIGDPLVMGVRQPQKYQSISPVAGPARSYTYTFDGEGYPLTVKSVEDNLVVREITYDR